MGAQNSTNAIQSSILDAIRRGAGDAMASNIFFDTL